MPMKYLFTLTFTDLTNNLTSVLRPKITRGEAIDYIEAAYSHYTKVSLTTYEYSEDGKPTARIQIEPLGGHVTA